MSKARLILFSWELGRGMGHIYRLLPIARELVGREFRISFALRSRTDAGIIPTILPNAQILQAPYHIRDASLRSERLRSAYDYADMLFYCGYHSRDSLESLVTQWHILFDATKPDLIVCDHSPTVVLAAAGRVPVVQVGSGFSTPPQAQPFLGLYPPAIEGAGERRAQVLASIAELRGAYGMSSPNQVHEMFEWAEAFPCSLPELDPYRDVRPRPALGPIHGLPQPKKFEDRSFIFGYLAGDDLRVPSVLKSLARSGVRSSLYIRQAPRTWAEMLQDTSVRLFDAPQQLNEVIGAASAVLHHGGVTTSEIALALGRPQFILPRYVEQGLTAEAIEAMGCGRNLRLRKEDVGECIKRALSKQQYVVSTMERAQRIASRPKVDVKAMIIAACLRHLV